MRRNVTTKAFVLQNYMGQMSVRNCIRSVCFMLHSGEGAAVFHLLEIFHVTICALGCQLDLQVQPTM